MGRDGHEMNDSTTAQHNDSIRHGLGLRTM